MIQRGRSKIHSPMTLYNQYRIDQYRIVYSDVISIDM